jgi:YtkA-like
LSSLYLLCLAGCLALAGCGGTPVPTQLTQTVGTMTATLAVRPYPPVPMQDTRLELALQDAGQPVSAATVRLTLTMPGCRMAPSYPEMAERADGLYAAETVLTMAGSWQVDADVSLQGKDVRFTFFFATR